MSYVKVLGHTETVRAAAPVYFVAAVVHSKSDKSVMAAPMLLCSFKPTAIKNNVCNILIVLIIKSLSVECSMTDRVKSSY